MKFTILYKRCLIKYSRDMSGCIMWTFRKRNNFDLLVFYWNKINQLCAASKWSELNKIYGNCERVHSSLEMSTLNVIFAAKNGKALKMRHYFVLFRHVIFICYYFVICLVISSVRYVSNVSIEHNLWMTIVQNGVAMIFDIAQAHHKQ